MGKVYSVDLRERALDHLERNRDIEETSKLFKVGPATLYRWKRLEKTTGSVEPKKRTSFHKKIIKEKLEAYIEEHPDQFLSEIADAFSVTIQAIFYALRRFKITRKKKLFFIKSEMKKSE